MTPNQRRAQDALIRLDGETIVNDGLDAAIIDQLTNLMHLAAQEGLVWTKLSSHAAAHQLHEALHG